MTWICDATGDDSPSPWGPRIAERSTLVGLQTGGGLGKPLGGGEGELRDGCWSFILRASAAKPHAANITIATCVKVASVK